MIKSGSEDDSILLEANYRIHGDDLPQNDVTEDVENDGSVQDSQNEAD